MDVKIEQSWKNRLNDEFEKEYFKKLTAFVKEEYLSKTIYPNPKNIFNAFEQSPFDRTRVVILGQDPYHGPGQAHGLCFSVLSGVDIPPSLKNIFKELKTDIGNEIPKHGDLSHWASQGVLLLNATLTVQSHQAGSHQGKGWETFTDAVMALLSKEKEHLVFILWGSYAQKKGVLIDKNKHLVLEAPHPSPLSSHRGFFGSRPFSKTNEYLVSKGLEPVQW